MTPENDYIRRGCYAALALIVILAGLSFVPPHTIGSVTLRRANIFSDLFRFEESISTASPSQVALNEEEYSVDMAQVSRQIVADTLLPAVQTTFRWQISAPSAPPTPLPDSLRFEGETKEQVTPIEDFDPSGNELYTLYDKMLSGKPVRIAFMGDSFVEGDILTADLRERLQDFYGGSGAGFAPMASPLTAFRRTVKTQAKGWTAYNIMQHRTTPESLRDNYYISGWVCQPSEDAQTRWECSSARKHLGSREGARILFISRHNSTVEAIVNDTLKQMFSIEGNPVLRQIEITGGPIQSLAFRIVSGHAGVIGYGAVLGSNGVGVDNYSIRSNNGQAMFRTNPTVNVQANEMLQYDLIILQYGLNIMQQGIRNYANYGSQIGKMIAYARECFPTAAILVMGVSDRCVRTESGVVSMDAIPAMIQQQRQAASANSAAFWDTAAAMRSMGGMQQFVANGWAGKDFTHINYGGGQRIAHALAEALNEGARKVAQTRERIRIRKVMGHVIPDSIRQETRKELLTPVILK